MIIRPEHTGTFLRFKKLISHSKGFQLLIIDYNIVSYRDFIIQSLNNQNYDTCVIDSLTHKDYFDLEQALFSSCNTTQKKIVTHIINFELNSQSDKFYTGFNYHRERIANNYPHTLILWLSQSAIQQLSEQAIDFWSWREQVFNFFIEPDNNSYTILETHIEVVQDFNIVDKKNRKKEILDFLENKQDINDKLKIDLFEELAKIDRLLGLYKSSNQYLEQAKFLSSKIDDKLSYYLLLKDEAELLILTGQYDDALNLLQNKILPNIEFFDSTLEIANTQSRIADILSLQGKYDKALALLKNLLSVYKQHEYYFGIANIQLRIADIFKYQNKYQNALDLLTKDVLPIYESLEEKRGIALTKGEIATILTHQGFYDKALEIRLTEELPIYEQLGEIRTIAIIEGKIADIYMLRGDFKKALEIRLEKEIPIYKKLGDIRELAISQGKVADIYMFYGKYDEALKLRQEEEIPIYIKLDELNCLTIAKTKIVDILIIKSKYQQALDILQNEIFPIYKELNNLRGTANAKGKIADIFTHLKQYDRALNIRINEELPMYQKINEQNDIAITYLEIAQLYQFQKKYDNAINIYNLKTIPLLENLGDLASLTTAKFHLALAYLKRNPNRSRKTVEALLRWCYKTAQELHLPDLETIKQTMLRAGINP